MIWQDGELKNPFSGKLLRRDSPHSFSDDEMRFPVLGEIPFLRGKREKLNAEVLRALDLADDRAALMLLLQDQDDWAQTAAPTEMELQPLFENQNLTLREAMQSLKYESVADYFTYRWSDPTFLSGLALLDRHLPDSKSQILDLKSEIIFELCCGIGHYLRALMLRGFAAVGADFLFSKLWLARKLVAPEAKLVCFDANFDFPFAKRTFSAAFCHDAFYFLPEKKRVAAELKRTTDRAILIGHAHNGEVDNFSGGAAVSVREYADFFENAILYDDEELTRSLVENRAPRRADVENLKSAAAIAVVQTQNGDYPGKQNFDLPPPNRSLKINPLLFVRRESTILNEPRFPSARYLDEYAALSDYLNLNGETIGENDLRRAANGDWFADERLRNLARRRILLDLPEKW